MNIIKQTPQLGQNTHLGPISKNKGKISLIALGILTLMLSISLTLLPSFSSCTFIAQWSLEIKIAGACSGLLEVIFIALSSYKFFKVQREVSQESRDLKSPSTLQNSSSSPDGTLPPSNCSSSTSSSNQEKPKDRAELLYKEPSSSFLQGGSSTSKESLQKLEEVERAKQQIFAEKRAELENEIDSVNRILDKCQNFFSELTERERIVIALFYINYRCMKDPGEKRLEFTSEFEQSSFKKDVVNHLNSLISQEKQKFLGSPAYHCAFSIYKSVNANRLLVTASKQAILESYLRFNRLILLRPLQHETLLLGCGLGGCRSDIKGTNFAPYFAHNFAHYNVDTVNIALEMNPSVLCFWGDPEQMPFFKERYSLIYDEGPIISFIQNKQQFWEACTTALSNRPDKESIVVIKGDVYQLDPTKESVMKPHSDQYELTQFQIGHSYSYHFSFLAYRRTIVKFWTDSTIHNAT